MESLWLRNTDFGNYTLSDETANHDLGTKETNVGAGIHDSPNPAAQTQFGVNRSLVTKSSPSSGTSIPISPCRLLVT